MIELVQKVLTGIHDARARKEERQKSDEYRRSLPVYPIASHLADLERSQSEGTLKYWSPGTDGRERIIGHEQSLELFHSDRKECERRWNAAPKVAKLRTQRWGRSSWWGTFHHFDMTETYQELLIRQWGYLTWRFEIVLYQPVQSDWAAVPRDDFIRITDVALGDSFSPGFWERKAESTEYLWNDPEAVVRIRELISRADYEPPQKKDIEE